MPITTRIPIRRLSQRDFGEISFEVMRHVFAIHNEIGRFFDEKIYKCELTHRVRGVRLEEPIDVTFGSFHKRLFIDVLAGDGAIFEFKSAETLTAAHQTQLLQYLLLCGVAHGKLINVRPEVVEHEFVNTHWEYSQRVNFDVQDCRWNSNLPGAAACVNSSRPC